MKIAVIGAGISGVAVASMLQTKGHDVVVFEKEHNIGGLIQCDWVEGNLFHKVGGHVFNSKNQEVLDWFWSHFDKEKEFYQAHRNAKIWLNEKFLGYPIENYLYQLDYERIEKIINELLLLKPKRAEAYDNFEAFLKGSFGPTLYELYFRPYNEKMWNTDLSRISLEWLEGKLPMPNLQEIILSNITQQEETGMVHSFFYYPKKGGSQFIINRLADGLDIRTDFNVNRLVYADSSWSVNGETDFDAVIYTGDVRKVQNLIQAGNTDKIAFPDGLVTLKSNGTSNVFCYTDPNDLTWLYLPDKELKAHRIIYTGNFSPENNASETQRTCVVEFSGKLDESEMFAEIGKLPGNLKPLRINYQPNSYVIQDAQTRDLVSRAKAVLRPLHFHLCGRFAEWEYYNMDKAIEAAMDLVDRIG